MILLFLPRNDNNEASNEIFLAAALSRPAEADEFTWKIHDLRH